MFDTIAIALAFSGMIIGVIKTIIEHKRQKEASDNVREAERLAFIERPAELEIKLRELAQSQEGLEERTAQISQLINESKEAISVGRLFNLYSKQIEKYQQETRTRV